ncbi:aerial mycelium formation protein [Quadrisphaera sp. DSM 44207]|uniref:RsiG family protein n=1 Tax=Quadrisphaera sp. DSM 44207 TaxID=1881057 RepID=UPI000AF176F4|nr:aerial mycelium formation protein [Quadrisphaera sp. DSM 44207]
MTVEYRPGGRRRIDQVLSPDFLAGVGDLDDSSLRRRRDLAQQEETDLSYTRRLLQGRLDLLEAERAHRTGERPAPGRGQARSDEELAEALARILADDTRSTRGSGRFLSAQPSRVGEHRREAELAVADVRLSAPAQLDDADLADAVTHLRELERRVSGLRRRVQDVEAALTLELTRRFEVARD